MEYRIAWMFPDILFMHGERGNVDAIRKFATEAGYKVAVDRIDFDTTYFDPMAYDAIIFGVGEISSFPDVISWLRIQNEKIKEYIASGRPMLVTGTSQAIFAKKIIRADGTEFNGLGYLPVVVKEKSKVYGADIIYDCTYNNKTMRIVGSQIMMMDIEDDDNDSRPKNHLGTISYGYGNNNHDKNEGFLINNAVFTNCLGPMLVCNPWLSVEMIKISAKLNGDNIKTIDESFKLERASEEAKVAFNIK